MFSFRTVTINYSFLNKTSAIIFAQISARNRISISKTFKSKTTVGYMHKLKSTTINNYDKEKQEGFERMFQTRKRVLVRARELFVCFGVVGRQDFGQ